MVLFCPRTDNSRSPLLRNTLISSISRGNSAGLTDVIDPCFFSRGAYLQISWARDKAEIFIDFNLFILLRVRVPDEMNCVYSQP